MVRATGESRQVKTLVINILKRIIIRNSLCERFPITGNAAAVKGKRRMQSTPGKRAVELTTRQQRCNERSEIDRIISLLFYAWTDETTLARRSRQGRISVWPISGFERATQIMPNYRFCWQHLADEYRTTGKVAEANRAAAPVLSLSSAAPKQAGIRSSQVEPAMLIMEQCA
jgi:hypothetical protein